MNIFKKVKELSNKIDTLQKTIEQHIKPPLYETGRQVKYVKNGVETTGTILLYDYKDGIYYYTIHEDASTPYYFADGNIPEGAIIK